MNKNLDLEYKHEWLQKMADVCEASSTIDSTLFDKYEVKRGLRDLIDGDFRDSFLHCH